MMLTLHSFLINNGDNMENIIQIKLKSKEDYQNNYNENILSYRLSNYILEETKGINTKEKIKFNIILDFYLSEQEKTDLVDMIRNNFGADISEIINKSKKQQLANLILLIFSSILIILSSIIKIEIIAQFILILGWILQGEAICNFLYKSIDNKYNISRRKQIVNAKVFFQNK